MIVVVAGLVWSRQCLPLTPGWFDSLCCRLRRTGGALWANEWSLGSLRSCFRHIATLQPKRYVRQGYTGFPTRTYSLPVYTYLGLFPDIFREGAESFLT
jgi:hypothetical protein